MQWNHPTSWFGANRTRAPHERPREYNDPSKQHELGHFYDKAIWPDIAKASLLLIPVLALLAGAGYIVFNVVTT